MASQVVGRLRPKAGPARSYGTALASVAIAFAATYATWPALRPTPWALFFVAVTVTAWIGGMAPSLVATALAAILGNVYFLPPYGSASLTHDGLIPTVTFLAVALTLTTLASSRRRVEADERAERTRFQATMMSIGDAVIATGAEGRVTFMNGVAEELTGWAAREAEGRRLEEVFVIVNEGTGAPVANPVAKVLETGRIQGLANHTVLIARDGARRPIDDSASPIRIDGRLAGVVLVFRDISERKAAEADRARLAAIVESSDDVIIGKTLDGIIRLWNDGAERVFGFSAAEAVGQPITLIIPPDRLEEERDILDRLGRGERIEHFETVRVTKAGRLVDISLSVSPIRDAEGRVVGASKVARDVTGRKATEAERARLAETLRLALDAADLGTWDWDPATDQVTLSSRGAEIYGLTPDRTYAREWMRGLIQPEDRDRAREAAARAAAGRSEYDMEYRLDRPGQGPTWVSARGRGVYAPGGELVRMLGVVQDVTARKEAEAALQTSEGRHRALAGLAAATQPLTDPAAIMRESARLLAEHLGADRCAYAEVEDESIYVITGDHPRGVPSIVGRWPVASFGAEHLRMMRADEPYIVEDADADPRIGPDDLPAFRATAIRAVICVPLHKEGRLTAAMAVHQKTPRRWTPEEVELVTAIVGRCWEALERSRIARDLRESEARFRAIVAASPECVKLVAPDGILLQMNRAGLEMVEGDESALGRSVYDLVAPEDREAYRAFNERVCRGERGTLEFDIIGLHGTRRHMETTAVPLPAPLGGFNQLAVARDVTARRRAEAALREKDERLKLLIDNTKDYAVIILDPRGTIVEWQGAAERITGYAPGEAVGRGPELLFTPEDRAAGRPEAEMARAAREGRADDRRWHRAKDDSRFYADGVMTALYDDAGKLRGFGKVFKDATGEKRAEEERQVLTARIALQARLFDTALSNTPDFLYTFDLAGRFTYVNHALLALWQKGAEEAVGKDFFELDYPPELAARLQDQIRQVIDTKSRVSDETPYTSAFGERYYEYIFAPVLAPDGTVEAVAGSTRDITGRKQAEEATRRRAAQLQKLAGIANRINSAHDVNSVLRVVTEEARELVGTRRAATSMVLDPSHPQPINVVSDSGGRTGATPLPGFDGLAFYEAFGRPNEPIRLTRGEIESGAARQAAEGLAEVVPAPNGWLAAPLVGRSGRNMGLIQLFDRHDGDFTEDDEAILVQLSQLAAIAIENARLYQELRSNDERKDEFLAMLAHELRNPLAAIGNAVKVTSKSDAREHIEWSTEVIGRQLRHLSRLIDDLMDVSRITRGKIELRRDVLEATPILESAAATVRALVEERRHTLELDIERGALWVDVDPTRLEQVVVNLLNNAAKYSENEGHILLFARNEAGEVAIGVKDRGVGIPPEKLPEMFELFAQGDRSLARSEGGLGIGLTVVKKLVEMHGGTVVATSDGPGKGSEFVIRLPAARRPPEPQPPASDPVSRATGKARILVVDDNVDTARGMARLLNLIGNEVATAHSGPEAIEAARAHRPDFILLDIGLPGMSGYEVAARLRREECCREAVIVAISGYGQEEDRRRSKQAGFDFHLVKPLDHDALLTLLSRAGDGRT